MLLLGGSFRRFFGRLLDAVFAIEPLDAPRGIDQALRASVKGMALRADLDVKLFERRARFEGVAARTDDSAAAVFRMDSSFHFNFSNSAAYCVAGYHRKVSRTIRPLRLPFRAFRIALATSFAAIIITICANATYAASSPAKPASAPTASNAGFAPDSRTLFAPIVYLAPPGPARASRAIAILNRQLDFQRKISFHPKIGASLQEVIDLLPPRQSTMIRAAALYSKNEIPWRDQPDGTHQICVAGQPDDADYLYTLVQQWRSPEEPARFAGVFGLKPAADSTPDNISSVTGTLGGELMIDTYGLGALVDTIADTLREFHGDLKPPWDTAPGSIQSSRPRRDGPVPPPDAASRGEVRSLFQIQQPARRIQFTRGPNRALQRRRRSSPRRAQEISAALRFLSQGRARGDGEIRDSGFARQLLVPRGVRPRPHPRHADDSQRPADAVQRCDAAGGRQRRARRTHARQLPHARRRVRSPASR